MLPFKRLSYSLSRIHSQDVAFLQRLSDLLFLTWSFVLFTPTSTSSLRIFGIPAWCLIFIFSVALLPSAGIYTSYRHRSLKLLVRRITSRWIAIILLLIFCSFIQKNSQNLSRLNLVAWASLSWIWLIFFHVWLRKIVRNYRSVGGNKLSIIYWGIPEAALAFSSQIKNNPWIGFHIAAWFSPTSPAPHLNSSVLPPCSGSLNEMRQWLNIHDVDYIFFSHVTTDNLGMDKLITLFGDFSVPVIYSPHWAHPTMRFSVDAIGSQPCIYLWGPHQTLSDRQLKRAFDILMSFLGLLFIAPFLLLIAIAIKITSPGPIFYLQIRYGLDGKKFKCIKFRSMYHTTSSDDHQVLQATINDSRVTPLGNFLRKWSIDELPQLFNVLKGEMSLVGPRPHAVQHNELYRKIIPGYMQRHAFKPGITGLAQVEGWRGETRHLSEMENRVYSDLIYQRDWSFSLDIKILIKTFIRLRSGNAY
ncbi:MAG: exopolysaccharide biosynthesis polyprenyl glycosylphosphotransferase [Synechococcus sp. YX04-3]|nr:MAG: exopolysaccharide biosynthesis polyprenyl glycosylphosphotransferase [Synechococcus sp. YX04-3]